MDSRLLSLSANPETWFCLLDVDRSIPFASVEQGHVSNSSNFTYCFRRRLVKIFPRPYKLDYLRTIVHGQTLKYNMKVRAGRLLVIPKKLASHNKELLLITVVGNRSLGGLSDSAPEELATAYPSSRTFYAYLYVRSHLWRLVKVH
ncbi:hypothetical protein NC651_023407 [Populus alba x Populus x berolinensis]|nr:hypothetical protein NC651_023407 [Populus alba x Populus x berolinensis]